MSPRVIDGGSAHIFVVVHIGHHLFGIKDGMPRVSDAAWPRQLLQMVGDALKCASSDLRWNGPKIDMVRFRWVIQRKNDCDDGEVTGLRNPLVVQGCFFFLRRSSSRL